MDVGFKFVGGDLALDFVNTVSWSPGHETAGDEKLCEYADVVAWARERGVVTGAVAARLTGAGGERPSVAKRVLRRGLDLRRALHEVLLDVAEGRRPHVDQLQTIENELARTPLRFGPSPDGGLDWDWDGDDGASLDRVLWPIVWHAVDLVRAPEWAQRVKSCAADRCGWLFLDESRRGNRKWCDMADCGNRAKVRRYYRKHRR